MSASRILSADRVIVCDGAMGTMIHSKGVPLGQSFDEVNIDGPAVVEGIHKAYVEAGAEILETNTFGANRIKLENYGLSHKVRELNIAGARIANRQARRRGRGLRRGVRRAHGPADAASRSAGL
jgi:homocysteine S-methyltransferase